MPFLSSSSWRWICHQAHVPPQAGGGHEQGSHNPWCGRAGMEFGSFYSSLWVEGCVMLAVGSPKGRRQVFTSSQWPGRTAQGLPG